MRRITFLAVGIVIGIVGVLLGPLPGPFGLPVVLLGMILILRNSGWARRTYVRANRRWPKYFHWPNRVIRPRRRRRKPAQSSSEAVM